jgi:malate permease and related proteins
MSEIMSTIAPVFLVILLGAILRRRGLIREDFLGVANQLVYFVAIPAMIFREISGAPIFNYFRASLLVGTLLPLIIVSVAGLLLARILGLGSSGRQATFVQGTFHGNLGYIGLAVAYYYLGESGLARAAIISGFLMLLQNIQAVFLLTRSQSRVDSGGRSRFGMWFHNVAVHPVILSAMAGILFSLSGWSIPTVLDRSLKIVGGMALPLALLLIGASLSPYRLRIQFPLVAAMAILKLLCLPLCGLLFYHWFGLASEDYMPGLILLAAPTATVVYVMAKEMGGDPSLASGVISASTLGSALTYMFWLGMTSQL